MKGVYLDNNATTQVAEEVVNEMGQYFTEYYGNPSSIHSFGIHCKKKIDEAREKVATLIGAQSDEIVFTSGGTESDNAALLGIVNAYPKKRHIITTQVEHPAIKNLCDHLSHQGYHITLLPVNEKGLLSLEQLEKAITPNTLLVSVMWANNETGSLFPLTEIAEIVKKRGIILHSDAIQAIGKIPINMNNTQVDILSLSGHKFHAPKGIGALYIRKGIPFIPLFIGGHQENGRRSGTENVPGIIGLGKACELAISHSEDNNTRVKAMRDRLERGILERIDRVYVNGDEIERLPNTTNLSFEDLEAETILLLLDKRGIYASSGAACSAGRKEPSRVLTAMGVSFQRARGSVRFSLSRYTTEEEINYTLENIPEIIKTLRHVSSFQME